MSAAVLLLHNSSSSIFRADDYYAKKLSTDKKPEPYQGGYIIYANGTRWYFESFVTWELVWIPNSLGPVEKQLSEEWSKNTEYRCTWLSNSFHYNAIKRIIYTHPNLDAPNWYWQFRKFFNI